MGTTLNDSLHIFHFKCPSPSTRFLIGNQTCCKCSKTLCGSLFTKHIRDACIKVYKTSEKRERNLHRLVQPYLHPHEELERNIITNLDDIRAITHTQFCFYSTSITLSTHLIINETLTMMKITTLVKFINPWCQTLF